MSTAYHVVPFTAHGFSLEREGIAPLLSTPPVSIRFENTPDRTGPTTHTSDALRAIANKSLGILSEAELPLALGALHTVIANTRPLGGSPYKVTLGGPDIATTWTEPDAHNERGVMGMAFLNPGELAGYPEQLQGMYGMAARRSTLLHQLATAATGWIVPDGP